jgi:hypothetical protein
VDTFKPQLQQERQALLLLEQERVELQLGQLERLALRQLLVQQALQQVLLQQEPEREMDPFERVLLVLVGEEQMAVRIVNLKHDF